MKEDGKHYNIRVKFKRDSRIIELTSKFGLVLLLIQPVSFGMRQQNVFIADIRAVVDGIYRWCQECAVAQITDGDGLVDGKPGLHAVPVQIVDYSRVVFKPVGDQRIGPPAWKRGVVIVVTNMHNSLFSRRVA